MSNVDLEEYKRIKEEYDEAVATEREMQTELKLLKKQSIDILKSYGYTSFSDINKMNAKIDEMQAEINKTEQEMLDYVKYVNEKKTAKDNIILG